MFRKSLYGALLLASVVSFGSGAASAQALVRPDMPPGYDEVEPPMIVYGADGNYVSHVFKNKQTGEERRVLTTLKGAIRRYLIGPVKPDDQNYTWVQINDVCCSPQQGSHQFPVPKPDPELEGQAYDPGTRIGKQGWSYGSGKDDPPPGYEPEKTEKKSEKPAQDKQSMKTVQQKLDLPAHVMHTAMPTRVEAGQKDRVARNARTSPAIERQPGAVKTTSISTMLHTTKAPLTTASFAERTTAAPKLATSAHATTPIGAKR